MLNYHNPQRDFFSALLLERGGGEAVLGWGSLYYIVANLTLFADTAKQFVFLFLLCWGWKDNIWVFKTTNTISVSSESKTLGVIKILGVMRRFLLNNVAIFATKIVLFCRINKKMGNNCDISMINDIFKGTYTSFGSRCAVLLWRIYWYAEFSWYYYIYDRGL